MNVLMYSALCAILFLCPHCRCDNNATATVKLDRNVFAFKPTNETTNIKISKLLLPSFRADHLSNVSWFASSAESLYCVSDGQHVGAELQFKVVNKGNTVKFPYLKHRTEVFASKTINLSQKANFSSIMLLIDPVLPELNEVTIVCEERLNGSTIRMSTPLRIDVKYVKKVSIVYLNTDTTYIENKVVYIECIKDADGKCQGQNSTLTCATTANPPLIYGQYNWWQNGHIIGHGKELAINPEMSGSAIQCSVDHVTNRFSESTMSQTLMIQAYSSAHLLQVAKVNQNLTLTCVLEGTLKQHAIWKMRRPNGLVTSAPCLPGASKLRYLPNTSYHRSITKDSLKRMLASCELHVTDDSYTGQYWCCADNSDPSCLQSGLDKKVAEVEVQGADFNVGTTTAR
uniref:Ig-like domain-containing protein n=1 Tax=Panagrellus redivivus TaxID=6233 RepID=A0A7E5A2A0_PANRE